MFAAKDALLTRPSGGYTISRSLRFRSSASAYLNRTFGTPTDVKTQTLSLWIKRGRLGNGAAEYYLLTSGSGGTECRLVFNTDDTFTVFLNNVTYRTTTQVFRDPSAWYHLVFVLDTANATANSRFLMYVNGVVVSSFSVNSAITQNATFSMFSAVAHNLCRRIATGADYLDGYLAEVNLVDGQALSPTSFGATNATTGVWAPIKYAGTYGANGFHLDFNSYATTAALGTDTSGNGNTWTVNNVSVTAGVTYDSMIDVPTVGTTGSNYATWNPLASPTNAPTDGNLAVVNSAGTKKATIPFPLSGKWYWEQTPGTNSIIGICNADAPTATNPFYSNTYAYAYYNNGTLYPTVIGGWGATYNSTNIIAAAVDFDAATPTLKFYKDNVQQGSTLNLTSGVQYVVAAGIGGVGVETINFGQRAFTYTPPSGYSALNTYNLPAPTILKGNTVMDATLYTGTGASLSVTNAAGFQPDFVWMKSRSAATDNALYDSVRGATKDQVSNSATAETTQVTGLTAFGSTGFTVGALAKINTNAATYVGWQWKGGGAAVTNTNGTMSAQVSANPTSGCSICSFTTPSGTVNPNTFGHGLGVAPSFVITKAVSVAQNYDTYHVGVGNTARILLSTIGAASAANAQYWNNTTPSSTVVTIGTTAWWGSSTNYIAYCFAPIAGYSAFGSYVANNVADGPFVYLGFRPRFIMFKDITVAADWEILDTARSTFNLATAELKPNTAGAETTGTSVDFLSNGFKLRAGAADPNNLTHTYIYAAFAESPFKNSLAR